MQNDLQPLASPPAGKKARYLVRVGAFNGTACMPIFATRDHGIKDPTPLPVWGPAIDRKGIGFHAVDYSMGADLFHRGDGTIEQIHSSLGEKSPLAWQVLTAWSDEVKDDPYLFGKAYCAKRVWVLRTFRDPDPAFDYATSTRVADLAIEKLRSFFGGR